MGRKQPEALAVCRKEERRHEVVPAARLLQLPVQEENPQSRKEKNPAEWLGPGK